MSHGAPQGKFAKRKGIEKDKWKDDRELYANLCADSGCQISDGSFCPECEERLMNKGLCWE